MPRRVVRMGIAAIGLLAAVPAWAVPLSFTVSGQVAAPGTFDAATLGRLPQATQSVTYRAGSATVADTFTGPTLASVLQAAGGTIVDPSLKNGVLRQYGIATGADGYRAVISTGEIAARFGNRTDLVATSDALDQLPNPSGFARLVATGDVAGGRYVSNLVDLSVQTAPAQPGTGGGVSSSFTVGGAVSTPSLITRATLDTLKPYQQTVTFLAGSASVTDTYTGVLLWDVLNAAGLVMDASVKNDALRKLVSAVGTDGYQVDFALGELSPSFGNAPILVAYDDTAGQIAGGAGFARLVVPGDVAGGRYVSNLASLTVFDGTAVPEPGSLALLIAALLGLQIGPARRTVAPQRGR